MRLDHLLSKEHRVQAYCAIWMQHADVYHETPCWVLKQHTVLFLDRLLVIVFSIPFIVPLFVWGFGGSGRGVCGVRCVLFEICIVGASI